MIMLEYIVLGILSNRSLTGYDIRKYIEQGIGMFYKASYGSIYPILEVLSKRGLIEYTEELHGKRLSKVYSITDSGQREFEFWLEGKECSSSQEFMAVVYFLDQLPSEQAASKIEAYTVHIDEYLDNLYKKQAHYEQTEGSGDYYYMMSTLQYGIYTLNNLKKWCLSLQEHSELDSLLQ